MNGQEVHMEEVKHTPQSVIEELLPEVVQLPEPAVLASGQESIWYINVKGLLLNKDALNKTIAELTQLLVTLQKEGEQRGLCIEWYCGVPTGGLLAAQHLLYQEDLNLRQLLVERKDGDGKYEITATPGGIPLEPGSSIIIIEDVVTTGTSSKQVIEDLEKLGFEVGAVVAIVHRDDVCPELEEITTDSGKKVPFVSLARMTEIIEYSAQQQTL